MKIICYPTLFCILILLYSSCSIDEELTVEQGKPIRFVSEVLTRSAMESGFAVNDNVGVFMLKRELPAIPATLLPIANNWISNALFFLGTDGEVWESIYPIYWDDQSSIFDVISYFPYRDFLPDDDLTQIPIQVADDQSSLDSLRNSDFLYATCNNITPAKHNDKISLGFKHKLCKLTVSLNITVNGEVLTSSPSVVVRNVHTNATINLTDGVVHCGDEISDVIFHYDTQHHMAEAILPPQTLKAGTSIYIIIKPGESLKAYTYEIREDLTMKEGKEYIINFNQSVTTK